MIENAVTSVAVPDVDEIAQKCAFWRSFGMPNTLHISSNVISGYSYLIHMAFAASIGDPPPIATIQSGWNASIAAAPFITVSTDGSGSIPSNNWTSIPASSRYCFARSRKPKRFIDPPPTQIIARFPSNVLSASKAPFPWYRSRGNVNLAIAPPICRRSGCPNDY